MRPEYQSPRPKAEFTPLGEIEIAKKLNLLRQHAEEFAIEMDAMCKVLKTFLLTGDLETAMDFFARNNGPILNEAGFLTGPKAFDRALEIMEI